MQERQGGSDTLCLGGRLLEESRLYLVDEVRRRRHVTANIYVAASVTRT